MDKNNRETEKSLKRFLKKKIAYTAGLLVAFLISGSVGFATSEELASQAAATHDTLIANIEAQKAEVQALLEENEARLKQLKLDTDELIRKGEWYSKPIYRNGFPGGVFPAAQQVWFSYWFEDAGKSKDKTRSEWKNTIDAIAYRASGYENPKGINPYAKGEVANGILDSEKVIPEGDKLFDVEINGNIPEGLSASDAANAAGVDPYGLLHQGNGVYIDNKPWVEELDLGANIKPLSPELPEISKTVNVNVSSPAVTGPIINAINAPSTPTAPTGVTVTVTPPAAVGAITVTPPAAPTPVTPLDKTINTPNEPTIGQFTPTTIQPPVVPTIPVITVSISPSISIDAAPDGNWIYTYVFTDGNGSYAENAHIGELGVTAGEFDLKRAATTGLWEYDIKNYSAYNFSDRSSDDSYALATNTALNVGNLSGNNATATLAFFRAVYQPLWLNASKVDYDNAYGANAGKLRELVHMDTHGYAVSDFTARLASAGASTAIQDANDYAESMQPIASTGGTVLYVHNGSYSSFLYSGGTMTLTGDYASITNQYFHTANRMVTNINMGKIVINGDHSAGWAASNGGNTGRGLAMYNGVEGTFILNGKDGAVGATAAFPAQHNIMVGNDGLVVVAGDKSAYIYRNESSANPGVTTLYDDPVKRGSYNNDSGMIYLLGDESMGIYQKANSGSEITCGDGKGIRFAIGGYDAAKFPTATLDDGITEKAVGIYTDLPVNIDYHEIHMLGNSKNNVGVETLNSNISLGNGVVSVNGGEQNVGLHANAGKTITTTGDIIAGDGKLLQDWTSATQGTATDTQTGVFVEDGASTAPKVDTAGFGLQASTGVNIGALAEGSGAKITVNNLGGRASENIIGVSSKDGGTVEVLNDVEVTGMTVSDGSQTAMAAYTKGAGSTITLHNKRTGSGTVTFPGTSGRTILDTDPDIEIIGKETAAGSKSYTGVGLYADNGVINANPATGEFGLYIKAKDAGAGIVAANSGKVNAKKSTIEVNRGYAAYVDNATGGTIDISDSMIVLGGSATAFELPLTGASNITSTNSDIYITSNDVIAFKLTSSTAVNLTDVQTKIDTALGTGEVKDDGSHTKWKIGALDGAEINIDAAITDGSGSDSADSDNWFHRLIIQNTKINVKKDITVTVDQNHLNTYGENNAIGVVATSAGNAPAKAQTAITVDTAATVSSDRTDAPTTGGAIGAFANYGTITNNGTIKAETVNKNKGGIGILAVGGSDVTNAAGGTVTVDGEESIGMGGLEYRAGIGKEFTTVTDDVTTLTNAGDVTTLGLNGIGMYLYNNGKAESGTAVTGVKATNTGTITASGEGGVGMAVKGDTTAADTTVENTGTITVGNKGTGIFVQDAVKVADMGTMTLGEAANGLVADPNSDVTAIASANLTAAAGTKNQTAIVLKGATAGTKDTTPQTVGVTGGITLTGFENASGLYVQDKGAVTSTSAININGGQKDVGIYTNNGDVTSTGNITMDNASVNSVGMYTSNGEITNGATIQMNEGSQIGMVANGGTAKAVNTGTLDMAAQGAVGMLGLAGATITDSNAGGMTFTANKTFGIAADASTVILNGGGTLALDNSKEAIYVYANNGSDVTNNGALVINGVTSADPAKSVGIYLDSTGNNTLTNTSSIEAQASAVGVYANGDKTLTNGTYTATAGAAADNTVGIYLSNGATLNNLVVNANAPAGTAVGIYNAAGTATVGTGLALNMTGTGTGMYLANGANASGDKITVNNSSAAANVGVYYNGGAASHDTDIDIAPTSNVVVGLFANGAATDVTTTKNITDLSSTGIGVMANDGATVTNNGIITTSTAAASQSVGMYTATGNLKNTGTINVTDGLGVNIDNSGATGTGKFDGNTGIIEVNGKGAAISLDGTVSGQVVDAGTIDLQGNSTTSGIAVFAQNNAVVDFPMTLTGTYGTGVYAKAGSTVSGTIDGSGSKATIGLYTEDSTVTVSGATIKAGTEDNTATPAAPAIGWYQAGSSQTYTTAGNTIESAGKGSIGTYIANGNTNDSADTYNVGKDGIGVLTYGTYNTNGATFNLNGEGVVGIVSETGGTANIGTTGAVNVNFGGNGEILAFADGGTVNLGSQITSTGSGTLSATLNGNLTNTGTVTVENGAYGLVGAYNTSRPGYTPTYTISNTGNMTVKSTAVGMATVLSTESGATAPAPADVSLTNSGAMDIDGGNSVGMFASVGTVSNTGTMNVTNEGIGIYAKDAAAVSSIGSMTVTGATGYVYEGINAATAPAGSVTLNAGTDTQRSIGGYYLNVNGAIDQPTSVTVAGDYAIPLAIEGGTNNVTGNISDAAGFANSIGMFVKNSTTTANDVTVTGAQDNIGIYSENAALTTGTVTVGDSNDPAGNKTKASLGIYANKGSVTATDVTVGKDSIGLFGKEASLTANGNVTVADKGTGAYVDGTGAETVTINGNITTGKNALGAYGKNANVTATGNMDVSNGLSIGLVGTGTGDINYNGTATVAAKGSESASIAIYKGSGQGAVNTTGTFDVHEGGYAVYADNLKGATGTITVNNGANINLDKSAVGIYAGGNVNSNNTGNITVGESYLAKADHTVSEYDLNSVALYGEEGAQVSNSGNITVAYDHSVGVYVKTNTLGTGTRTTFTNNAGATITADNGGVGILAVQYSDVINKGTIIVNQTTAPSCGGKTVGVGLYSMSTFDNQGEVTINGGYGVFLADSTEYVNNGNMTLNNGAAVVGKGTYVNNGTVVIGGVADTSAQAGKVAAAGEEDPVRNGAIAIDSQGNVVINNQYIGGGAVVSDYDIILDNPTVDITGKPSFNANSVSGEISLAPNFINTGNGYSWIVNGFVNNALSSGVQGKPTINTSPLFMAHMAGTDLYVAKQPYAYLVAGAQFDNLYNGVDSLLALDQEGSSNDSTVLKQLNSYLDNIYNEQGQTAFMSEADRTLAEMRGDIYATTYKRMETIQNSFDNSFDELLNARNATKDSGKFSVIYQQGKYDDDTLGIDDYDYRVTGLMYMREYESRNYGSKFGYSAGFTVSRFDFDDAPTFGDKSKEDVYSLRAGLHNVHSFGEDGANDRLRLISRLELGYNRHEAERSVELDKLYKNKGNYNSMNVSLDNKLEGTIYRDLKTDVKVYGAINMEYGHMGKFTEKAKGDSGLELTVKGQDYYSIEPEVGVDASRRAYLGKKLSAKVFGDLAYGYELGNIGDKHRKAKVNGGTEDYYELIKPAEEKGRIKATVGLTLEKPNGFGITGDVQLRKHQNKSSEDFRYGLRLNYTF